MTTTPLLLLALLALAVEPASAYSSRSGCTATAKYPDGSEVERECIVEGDKKGGGAKSGGGSSGKGGINAEFNWLKDTRWNWNNWREVIFRKDGSFLAPAENCEQSGNPSCKWTADEDRVYVQFGGAGMHTLMPSDDQQMLTGSRDRDGDNVQATRVG